jgi:hypothetical protein
MSDVCGLLHSCGMIAIFGLPLHHHKIDSCDHLVLRMILTDLSSHPQMNDSSAFHVNLIYSFPCHKTDARNLGLYSR